MSPKNLAAAVAACAATSVSLPALASCGSAFCSLNTDLAAEVAGIAAGSTFDLRYEAINQTQPRAGSDKVAVGQIPSHHDEISTRNRNLVATYSRTFESGWGFSVAAPFSDRQHAHIHHHQGEQLLEAWNFRKMGDMRLTGRYQVALAGSEAAPRTVGFVAGVKLPTGRTDVANADGDVAERSLQPGTGTTDVILGAFLHQQLPQRAASWFAQAQLQRAMRERDGFRPGGQFTVDLGYAQAFTDRLSGVVQLNAVLKGRDSGTQAEPGSSGSRSLFLSPGASWRMTDSVRAYAFYQHPLHQQVNGVQLTADKGIVMGISTRF